MNLDFWLAEYPSDYLLIVGILTEVLLAIIVYNLIRIRVGLAVNSYLRHEGVGGWSSRDIRMKNVTVMRGPGGFGILSGAVILIGWFVSFFAFLDTVPDVTEDEIIYLRFPRLLTFLTAIFIIQALTWVPMLIAYRTKYIVSDFGIWLPRGTSTGTLVKWSEVEKILREGTEDGPLRYIVVARGRTMRFTFELTGLVQFAKLAVDNVPAERRPQGGYALEKVNDHYLETYDLEEDERQ
jgi:hypothetical protein